MTLAMFRAMLLTLVNDRGALIMAFVLPIMFFLVIAEIFSTTSGGPVQLRVAFADEVQDELTERLLNALRQGDSLQVVGTERDSRAAVERMVANGTADVGVILPSGARRLDDMDGFGEPPILLLSDPLRGVALAMLSGQIQKAYFEAMPDVALGSVVRLIEDQIVEFNEEQRAEIEMGLDEMGIAAQKGQQTGWSFEQMFANKDVAGRSAATNNVAYFAGAVAFLFLLFSCMQGAVTLTEERESGVLERILSGPGGMAVLVNGKFLFLVFQGLIQMSLIFFVAWLVYDVDVPGNFGDWFVITLLASVSASGLSLAVAALCRTPTQARNLWTVVVLISSILGGSMVPRFFMPPWLRDLGWFTPNTWVVEAYSGVFWRDAGLSAVMLPCALLALSGLVSLLTAQWLAMQRARI